MGRRNVVIVLVLLLAALGAYYVYTNNNKASAANINVQTATVTRGNLIATVSSAGPVAARAQVMLNFGQSGTVRQLYVQVGDKVKQGQVLADLDATDLQLSLAMSQVALNQQQAKYDQTKAGPLASDLAAARAALDSTQANYEAAVRKSGVNDAQVIVARSGLDKATVALQKAQAESDIAIANHVTDASLLSSLNAALQQAKIDLASAQANYNIQIANINDTGVRSAASALESAKSSLDKLQTSPTPQDLQIAQAQLESVRISLQQTQYKLRNAQIIAPFDGIVTQINIDNFFSVGPTSQAIQISDLNKLQVTVNMAEVDIGKVKIGQPVNITMDALPDRPTLKGAVDQIALVAVIQSGVVNYPVVVTLIDPDPSVIKTGMTANVAIVVDRRDSVLLVPNRAIRTVAGRRTVQVVRPVIGTVPAQITVGLANDTQTEVLSGVNEGDLVAISGTAARTPQIGGGPGGGGFGPGGPRGD